MGLEHTVSLAANLLLLAGLVYYGFRLFAEYHSQGKWAKNVTSLLAGLGLLALALADMLSQRMAKVVVEVAHTQTPAVLLWVSNGLLLAAIAAFGAITYWKPLRLWHERKIERELSRERPKIS